MKFTAHTTRYILCCSLCLSFSPWLNPSISFSQENEEYAEQYEEETYDDEECQQDSDCFDGIDCTADTCDDGVCKYEADHLMCDDEVDCTVDACVIGAGCISEPNSDLCSDSDGFDCTIPTCDEYSGCIEEPDDRECEDGSAPCSADYCFPTHEDALADGCVHKLDVALQSQEQAEICEAVEGIFSEWEQVGYESGGAGLDNSGGSPTCEDVAGMLYVDIPLMRTSECWECDEVERWKPNYFGIGNSYDNHVALVCTGLGNGVEFTMDYWLLGNAGCTDPGAEDGFYDRYPITGTPE